jgi:aryl carrier-like protein
VGEICVGGPQVTRGYVRTELNEGVFVEHSKYGRLYRTGDLGKWRDVEGEAPVLDCLGRKDTQVKINGLRCVLSRILGSARQTCAHRIEVGEIEQHLTSTVNPAIVAAVVDKVEPEAGAPALVAFLSLSASFAASPSPSADVMIDSDLVQRDKFSSLTSDLRRHLEQRLPAYMVPRHWLPMTRMPVQQSGKTDRKRLRELASQHDFLGPALPPTPADDEDALETTDEVQAMRACWAEILRVAPGDLRSTDNFAQRGGDSIGFIRLVGLLRKRGYPHASFEALSLAGTLREAAKAIKATDKVKHSQHTEQAYEPFSLVGIPRERLLEHLAAELPDAGLSVGDIEDVWPATPAQDSLVAPALDGSGSYYAQAVYPLASSSGVSPEQLADAIERLVLLHPMLRSAFGIIPEVKGMLQVVFHGRRGGHRCASCPIEWLSAKQDIDEAINVPITHIPAVSR